MAVWVRFGFQLGLRHTQDGVDYKQCLCMPKAELKTKTNPNGHHPVAVWVRFGFQLGSLEKKCSGLRGKPCTGVDSEKVIFSST